MLDHLPTPTSPSLPGGMDPTGRSANGGTGMKMMVSPIKVNVKSNTQGAPSGRTVASNSSHGTNATASPVQESVVRVSVGPRDTPNGSDMEGEDVALYQHQTPHSSAASPAVPLASDTTGQPKESGLESQPQSQPKPRPSKCSSWCCSGHKDSEELQPWPPYHASTGEKPRKKKKGKRPPRRKHELTTSIIKRLFFMQTETQVTCLSCGNKVYRPGPRDGELLPPLPLVAQKGKKSRFRKSSSDVLLVDCLDAYFAAGKATRSDPFSFQSCVGVSSRHHHFCRHCSRCKATQATVKPSLSVLPPVRFTPPHWRIYSTHHAALPSSGFSNPVEAV